MSIPDNLSNLVSNETRLQWWSNNLSIANVVLVALTLVVTFFTYLVGTWLSKATEERTKKEKQISDEKIAQSYRQAENATAIAENAKLQQQKVTVELKIEQRALAEAQTSLTVSQKDLADAQRKQAEAELALRQKVDEVREKQAPRFLSEAQKKTMLDVLSKTKQGPTLYFLGAHDDETYRYTNEILDVLKASNWKVDEEYMFATTITGGGTAGIEIAVKDVKLPPAHAVALAEAFFKAGIQFRIKAIPNIENGPGITLPSTAMYLFIGHKPKL